MCRQHGQQNQPFGIWNDPLQNAIFGMWMDWFFQIFPNLNQNWLKFKKLLEKSGDFVQNLAQNLADWYMNGSLFLENLVCVWVWFQILRRHIPTKTKLEYPPGHYSSLLLLPHDITFPNTDLYRNIIIRATFIIDCRLHSYSIVTIYYSIMCMSFIPQWSHVIIKWILADRLDSKNMSSIGILKNRYTTDLALNPPRNLFSS